METIQKDGLIEVDGSIIPHPNAVQRYRQQNPLPSKCQNGHKVSVDFLAAGRLTGATVINVHFSAHGKTRYDLELAVDEHTPTRIYNVDGAFVHPAEQNEKSTLLVFDGTDDGSRMATSSGVIRVHYQSKDGAQSSVTLGTANLIEVIEAFVAESLAGASATIQIDPA